MIFEDLLNYFNLDIELPEYLYEEEFNDVFKKGDFKKENGKYIIIIETTKDVVHSMIIDPSDDYPVTISSRLPNGKTNGTGFGRKKGDLKFI